MGRAVGEGGQVVGQKQPKTLSATPITFAYPGTILTVKKKRFNFRQNLRNYAAIPSGKEQRLWGLESNRERR